MTDACPVHVTRVVMHSTMDSMRNDAVAGMRATRLQADTIFSLGMAAQILENSRTYQHLKLVRWFKDHPDQRLGDRLSCRLPTICDWKVRSQRR